MQIKKYNFLANLSQILSWSNISAKKRKDNTSYLGGRERKCKKIEKDDLEEKLWSLISIVFGGVFILEIVIKVNKNKKMLDIYF